MINNKEQNIIFPSQKMESLREGFGSGLLEAGEENKNIVALCADLTNSTKMNLFKEKFPDRFFNVGVAEQNLVTIASGMAATGKIPFISSYAIFSPGRNWEQIRTTVCLNNQKVVIVGSHTGVSVGPDGASHQMLEDIALMRVLPNMTVLAPVDSEEARKMTIESAKIPGPVYLRLARSDTPVFTTRNTKIEIGKIQILTESQTEKIEVVVFTYGPIAYEVILAGLELEKKGIPVMVVSVSTIKPLDLDIIKIIKKVGAVVVAEEHQIIGGLGSAIAEIVVQNYPAPIEFVGVHDRFGQSGTPAELAYEYELKKDNIILAIKKVLSRKVS